MSDVLLSVNQVSKKFCKHFHRSLWYGAVDALLPVKAQKRNNQRLRKHEFWAVRNASFTLQRGDILGILGSNGAGKTTLMRLISGIYPINSGQIAINGHLVQLFSKTMGMNRYYSGRDNIYFKAAMHGLSKEEIRRREAGIIAFSELENFIEMPLGNYSSGMRARLAFSIMLAIRPDILLLDEALAVGDNAFREKCYTALEAIRKNAGIVTVSHHTEQIHRIANRLIIMENGQIIHTTSDVDEGIARYVQQQRRKNTRL